MYYVQCDMTMIQTEIHNTDIKTRGVAIKPQRLYIFVEPMFFQFEVIINVLVSFFRSISIPIGPMLIMGQ